MLHNLPMRLIAEIVGGVLAVVLLLVALWLIRRKRQIKQVQKFQSRWKEIQKMCAKAESWPQAVTHADKLVDEVLKAAGYRGRTMGERLVAAQRTLSDNDGMWFAHKLSGRINNEEMNRLYKKDVQAALRGHRQALQDLGAL